MSHAQLDRTATYRGSMRMAVVVLVVVGALSTARADSFLSPGVSVAYGTRGWSFGVEVSTGILPNGFIPIFPGVVGGFEISPFATGTQPWGHLYGEVELTTLVGVGFGPNILLGNHTRVSWQLTTFLIIPTSPSSESVTHPGCGPLPLVVPYYRYTSDRETAGFHDAGAFGKVVFAPSEGSCGDGR